MTSEEAFPVNSRVERPPLLRQRNRLRTGTVIRHATRGKHKGWPVVVWDGREVEQHADPAIIRRIDSPQT